MRAARSNPCFRVNLAHDSQPFGSFFPTHAEYSPSIASHAFRKLRNSADLREFGAGTEHG